MKGRKIVVGIFFCFVMPVLLVVSGYRIYKYWCVFQWERSQDARIAAALEWSKEDEAKYAKLVCDLYEKFDELNPKERMETYEVLVEYACVKELGCPVPQVAYDKLDDAVSGQYGQGLICLNYSWFQDPKVDVREKIRTILHESRHAAQHHMVGAFRRLQSVDAQLYQTLCLQDGFQEILIWESDIENYDTYMEDFRTYYESDLESDARAFAEETERKLWAEYERVYSLQKEGSVISNAENKTFYPIYTAKDDMDLLWITGVASFVIGFFMLAKTGNRRISVGVVLAFMASFCYRTIAAESQTMAMENGFVIYPYLHNLLIGAVFFCLMMTYAWVILMEEKSLRLENLQLAAAALLLLVRSYACIWYIVFCVVWLFLLFYPAKKKRKAICRKYPLPVQKLDKVS